MKKTFVPVIVFALFSMAFITPPMTGNAISCYGSTCYQHDPMVYTNSSGYYCAYSTFTYTVGGAFQQAGTNGTVEVNLRYSNPYDPDNGSGCQANWSRAYVRGSNANTKQMVAKAYQYATPSMRHNRYTQGSPLAVNSMVYSYMINGSVVVTAVAAISGTYCSGDYGDPDTPIASGGCSEYYNPNIRYYG